MGINFDSGGKMTREKRKRDWFKRRTERKKNRRDFVIDRKKAQANIAKHRKWVMLWLAVIVVAIVVLVIFIMNKFSFTGLLF